MNYLKVFLQHMTTKTRTTVMPGAVTLASNSCMILTSR